MGDYKQQISNTNYFDKTINISLTRDEWNSADTWVSSNQKGTERCGKEWFQDLKWLILDPIQTDINFSDKNYKYDENITFQIPRELLRCFVFSIGRISYDIDVKPQTAMKAQQMIIKINKQIEQQLSNDDEWFKFGF